MTLSIGDRVRLIGRNRTGVIVAIGNKRHCQVKLDDPRKLEPVIRCDLSDLKEIERPTA